MVCALVVLKWGIKGKLTQHITPEGAGHFQGHLLGLRYTALTVLGMKKGLALLLTPLE